MEPENPRWIALTKFEWQRYQSALEKEHLKRVDNHERHPTEAPRARKGRVELRPAVVVHRASGAWFAVRAGDAWWLSSPTESRPQQSWLALSDVDYAFWFCINEEMEQHLAKVDERAEKKRTSSRRRYAALHPKAPEPRCFGME